MPQLRSAFRIRLFPSWILWVACLALAGCASLELRTTQAPPSGAVPILQGATSADTTQIAVLLDQSVTPVFTLKDTVNNITIAAAGAPRRHSRQGSPWVVHQARYAGLKPGVDYLFSVYKKGEAEPIDSRVVRALDSARPEAVFAVASCMDDTYVSEQKGMWEGLLSHRPDMIFLLGDNVYTDRRVNFYKGPADLATIWARHAETRAALWLFRARELVPVYVTWDDHDYGKNDGDRRSPTRDPAREILDAFFPRAEIAGAYRPGPGVARALDAFGQRFFFMDARSFRSPNNDVAEGETHWGKEQTAWIWREMSNAPRPAWIMSGDQFFGGYHPYESFQGNHPHDFQSFLDGLKAAPSPAVLVSGDRHLTELMEVPAKLAGYKTYELTTSAIHAKTFPADWEKTPNPLQIAGKDLTFNYAVIRSRAKDAKTLAFEVTTYGPELERLFRFDLEVRK